MTPTWIVPVTIADKREVTVVANTAAEAVKKVKAGNYRRAECSCVRK